MPQAFARFRTTFYLLGLADRKSTRLNSSHSQISYAVFCLKKKKIETLIILIVAYEYDFFKITRSRIVNTCTAFELMINSRNVSPLMHLSQHPRIIILLSRL